MRILTFDLEEWFHILDVEASRDVNNWHTFEKRVEYNTQVLREILNTRQIKATFFCLGWVAEKYPHLIKQLHDDGHDIGSHGYYHQLAFKQTRSEFTKDLSQSLDLLEDLIGEKITMYRAPGFSINSNSIWALNVLMELGITIDCSLKKSVLKKEFEGFQPEFEGVYFMRHMEQRLNLLYVNGIGLFNKELFLSGGGYFRFLPKEVFRRWSMNSSYFMTYFHPRDFDPDQRVLSGLSPIRRFKSYYGLSSALDKFKYLLDEFEFSSISKILDNQLSKGRKELVLNNAEKTVLPLPVVSS